MEHMWISGMPNTFKLQDLGRDPRFTLHTATVDTHVTDGDAKVWGVVRDVQDAELQSRYADVLYSETGIDVRGQRFDHLYAADLRGAASVEVRGSHLEITIWTPGQSERVVRKH